MPTTPSRSLSPHVAIVGAGHGGCQVAALLRQGGHLGDIVLIGQEPHLPYQRPPLSKSYLRSPTAVGDLLIRPEGFYREHSIQVRLGDRVTGVCTGRNEVELCSGERIGFDVLVLATGAVPRRLDVPGSGLRGVHQLRTQDDADALARDLRPGRRLVVVGGGYVGLEVGASARALGCEVVVLEREDRALARVASPELAAFVVDLHHARGNRVVTGADVASFADDGSGGVAGVWLADGRSYDCDVVVIGVGALPSDELARSAGLACDGGILVDAAARSSVPHVLAIGDVTRRPLHHYEGTFRLESIPSTVEQARQAVATILDLAPPKPEVPWFWSDQFDVKLKIAGLLRGVDGTVVRGSPADEHFSVFHFDGDRVVTVETVNAGADFMFGKKLIESGNVVDRARLADSAVALRDVLHG